MSGVFFLAVPPLLVSQSAENFPFGRWTFPFAQMTNCVLSVAFVLVFKKLFFIEEKQKPELKDGQDVEKKDCDIQKKLKFAMDFSHFLVGFGLLWLFSAAFQVAASLSGTSVSQKIARPEKIGWLFCALDFVFVAISEEAVYRFFLPEGLRKFAQDTRNPALKKILDMAAEIASAIVFALSHRYLGFFAVLNALCAHAVLRTVRMRTGSMGVNISMHFLYNFMSLIFIVMN